MRKIVILTTCIVFGLIMLNGFNKDSFNKKNFEINSLETNDIDVLNTPQREKLLELRIKEQMSELEEYLKKEKNNETLRVVVIDTETGKKLY